MNESDEAGFTLVEVLIAATLASLLALPAMSMLRGTYGFVDGMQSRFRLNEQARQITALLGDGSAILSNAGLFTGSRGLAMVEGLRSRSVTPSLTPSDAPPSGSQLFSSSQFVLPDGFLTLPGDTFQPVTITCTGPTVPVPACGGTETRTVQGWLGVAPTLSTSGQVAAVGLTLTDPFRAQRAINSSSATETYRTMFNLNVETNP
ncbi:MAG: prepilin-type N-terminal cleavage/methylation domain-containing protein [Janthinobacterium lividum]